jgi:hypothetical protein
MSVGRGKLRRGAPRVWTLGVVAASLAALPAYGLATANLEALAKLEPGLWQVRDLDGAAESLAVCIGDPLLLAQIEHKDLPCEREVVESGPVGGTVRYTCPGRGFGHSTLRIETPRLARIHTQGVRGNEPFDYRVEARRTGPC